MNSIEDVKQEFRKCQADCVYFIENYVKIVHPVRGLVYFKLYPFQKRIVKEIHQYRQTIMKKFRQAGASTIGAAYALWYIIFHANKKIAILSKDDEAAMEFLSRAKLMYQELPKWLKPIAKKNTEHRLDLENGSSIQSKASSKQSGRSISASIVFMDEAAFIENANTIWGALAPTISTGGKICLISTVNGIGNFYHKMWLQAIANENGFHPIQISYKEHPEYCRHEGYEWLYKELESQNPPINVDEWEAKTKARHTYKEWKQEYLSDFLGTGDTYIQGEILEQLKLNCNKNYWIKYNNRMRVWEDPKPHHDYVLAADPSIGRERDYSAFHIIDLYNGTQVAEFYSNRTPINEFAEIIAREGRVYNTAYVLSERNGIGNNLIYFLKETLEYENLVMDDDREIGIQITQKNRDNLLADMEDAIRGNRLKLNSERLVDELLTFVIDPDTGKVKADSNCHDDLIMSLAMAVRVFTELRGSSYIERDTLLDNSAIGPSSGFSTKYKIVTANGGTTIEDIKWLLGRT